MQGLSLTHERREGTGGDPVKEIIFFGRGGQGAVIASQALAMAAFLEEKHSQSFPMFGSERKGSPVTAYTRLSVDEIETREPILKADDIIVLDPAIFKSFNPFDSLKTGGCAVINSTHDPEELLGKYSHPAEIKIFTLDATNIANQIYGPSSIPRTNAVMLGAFVAATRVVELGSVSKALENMFKGELLEKARKALKMAYEKIQKQ